VVEVAQRNVFELVDPKRVDGVIIASGCLASFGALDDTIEYLSQVLGVAGDPSDIGAPVRHMIRVQVVEEKIY
jgi:hypothetical protein